MKSGITIERAPSNTEIPSSFPELFKTDVHIERNIQYVEEDQTGRTLDLYAPPNADGLPVAIFFFGGGWRSGDKRLFEHLGRAFAIRGIVTVTVNYRLTPAVRHPAHASDCAAAVGWVYRNIERFGGNPERLILTGHSAGAHLAALVAMDSRFLRNADVPHESIRGVVMMSGVADLRSHVRSTVFTPREYVEEAFGKEEEQLAEASPVTYVRQGLPPFLILVAEDDPDGLRDQGRDFADALREAGNKAMFVSIKGRDHFSIVRRFGPSDDPTAGAVAEFVRYASARS